MTTEYGLEDVVYFMREGVPAKGYITHVDIGYDGVSYTVESMDHRNIYDVKQHALFRTKEDLRRSEVDRMNDYVGKHMATFDVTMDELEGISND